MDLSFISLTYRLIKSSVLRNKPQGSLTGYNRFKQTNKKDIVQTDAILSLIPAIQYLTQNVDCTFYPSMNHHKASAVQAGPFRLSQSVQIILKSGTSLCRQGPMATELPAEPGPLWNNTFKLLINFLFLLLFLILYILCYIHICML